MNKTQPSEDYRRLRSFLSGLSDNRSDRRTNSVFAFLNVKENKAEAQTIQKSPLAALGFLCAAIGKNRAAEDVLNGEYVLVQYHLFVNKNQDNEHLLVGPRPGESVSVNGGLTCSQDADGALSTNVHGSPRVWVGLPVLEDDDG